MNASRKAEPAMNRSSRHFVRAAALAVLLGLGGWGLYQLGRHQGMAAPAAAGASGAAGSAAPADAGGRRVLYWHDPMVPGQKFDKPGRSPFMDMDLVPVYADAGGGGDGGGVTVSPRVRQNLGIRTAEAVRGPVAPRVEAVGSIAFNERDQAVVQARATGYVEKLLVRATLDRVARGQPLAELYVPEWVAAQEEFLALGRMRGEDLGGLVAGARQRMRQVGMSEAQIAAFERSGQVQRRVALVAPIGGVLVELAAREGMTVMPGTTLFRINGLSTVWANADVPETQAALLRPGAAVEASSPALPGRAFNGRVQAILPEVSTATRTVKARIELANPKGELLPGMFVTVALGAGAEQGLTVPSEAVIQTGRRAVVMLAEGEGRFRPVDVKVGREAGGRTEIRAGLQAGQQVVVSGQFLLDSESSLRAGGARLEAAPEAASGAAAGAVAPPAAPAEHSGRARVEAVTRDAVTLSHEPIASMRWGAMTMDFGAPRGGLPAGLAPGQEVSFAFAMQPDGTPVLTRIEPAAGAAPAAAATGGAK